MEQEKITDCEKTVLRGKIKNTGNRKGAQVVQLYVKNPRAWKARPARELRDFQKIILEAGEEKEFVFSISRELFELYDERVDERTVPQGMYGLELGFSVQDIRAAQKIEVTPVFPVPKQIQGWDKTERLLETKAGEQIFEELYRKITEKAGGIFAQRLKEEKNAREMLLSQPIRIVHLMIWNEMTDSELIAILEKVNQELYHDYREKMRSLEKKEIVREREKETETRKGNVSTTGERNVKERKAGDKKERCKRRQNGKIKCGILLLLICFLVVAVKNPAFAETETGNIEICIEDTGEQIKREGVTFQYSKVASLVDGAYEMEKRYEDKGVDLNEVRYAREQEELARTLSKYHYSDGLCRTDCDGKATLTNLRAGVYLIYVEDESEYEVQPVLVQLPKWEEDKGAMNWNVRVCPKQTIREEAAKTGDSQQAGAWAILCLGAGILILLLAVKKD